MDEFAMGTMTPNVINPINPKYYVGGSSGGSASCVSSGIVSFSLCSDTGGSTRIPASFCHIVGFRPSTNLISRYGLMELSSNMDSIGIMTKSIEQVIPILSVLTSSILEYNIEYDYNDMSQNIINQIKLLNDQPIKGLILNIANNIQCKNELHIESFKSYYKNVLSPIRQVIESNNIIINDIQLPNNEDIIKTYYIYVYAQTRSNLARFRGSRYKLSDDFEINKNSGLLGDEPRYRYEMGDYILRNSDPDELFNNLKRKLELWSRYILGDNMYLILPTHVEEIPRKDEELKLIDESYVILASILGLPSITIPIKRSDMNGRSIQLVGPKYSDFRLLKVACYLDKLVNSN